MIRISKLADYALVIIAHMLNKPNALASTHALAESTAIPEPTVSKILKCLARNDILQSERGIKGGYRLAREAEAISLADVIEAVEGPISVTECNEEGASDCTLHNGCPTRVGWHRVNAILKNTFQTISVEEMLKPVHLEEAV